MENLDAEPLLTKIERALRVLLWQFDIENILSYQRATSKSVSTVVDVSKLINHVTKNGECGTKWLSRFKRASNAMDNTPVEMVTMWTEKVFFSTLPSGRDCSRSFCLKTDFFEHYVVATLPHFLSHTSITPICPTRPRDIDAFIQQAFHPVLLPPESRRLLGNPRLQLFNTQRRAYENFYETTTLIETSEPYLLKRVSERCLKALGTLLKEAHIAFEPETYSELIKTFSDKPVFERCDDDEQMLPLIMVALNRISPELQAILKGSMLVLKSQLHLFDPRAERFVCQKTACKKVTSMEGLRSTLEVVRDAAESRDYIFAGLSLTSVYKDKDLVENGDEIRKRLLRIMKMVCSSNSIEENPTQGGAVAGHTALPAGGERQSQTILGEVAAHAQDGTFGPGDDDDDQFVQQPPSNIRQREDEISNDGSSMLSARPQNGKGGRRLQ